MDIQISLGSAGIGNLLMRLRNIIMFCLYYGIQDLVVNESTISLNQHANFVPSSDDAQKYGNNININKVFFKSGNYKLDILIHSNQQIKNMTLPSAAERDWDKVPYHSFEYIKYKEVDPNYFDYCPEKLRDILKQIWRPNIIMIQKKIVRKYLRDIFCIKADKLSPLSENELVIHIRSGDLFDDRPGYTCDHKDAKKGYIVPPLNYYKKVIESNNYEKIHIVAQDKGNPCIEELLKTYPNISLSSYGLEADIKLVLAAKHICASIGTFVTMLQDLTDNITRIYYPSFSECSFMSDTSENIKIDIDKPGDRYQSKFIGGWLNTKEQRDIILNWELP